MIFSVTDKTRPLLAGTRGLRLVVTGVFCFALPGGNAMADIYKCRHADGSTEISNRPCPSGSGTVTSRPDETISEARRREAERDVERLRNLVEQREAQQRSGAGTAASGAAREASAASSAEPVASPRRTVDDCLRELDRHPLDPQQRSQLDAACRSNPDIQPVIVPTPAVVPAAPVWGQPNPLGQCIQNVINQNLPALEKQQRIRQCEAGFGNPGMVQPRPTPLPPVNATQPRPVGQPAPKPPAAPNTICLPGSKFC